MKNKIVFPIIGILVLAFFQSLETCGAADFDIAQYNVVWDSPSTNATGSMPLSGGNFGLNVWVEGDDLLFYIGSPDSRVEWENLIKLGRVRMSFPSSPFKKNFKQELDLAEGCIRISGDGVKLKLWVDAFNPVVNMEMKSDVPVSPTVAYEALAKFNVTSTNGVVEWFYRNDPDVEKKNKWTRTYRIKTEGLESIADIIPDPLKNLTMGGRIVCPGLVFDGTGSGTYMRTPFKSWKLKAEKPVTNLDLRVLLRVAQEDSVESWRGALDQLQQIPSDPGKTVAWWREFWNRSWISINPDAKPDDAGWQVGRNYQLFRYMLAANRTGKTPTLFNGGFFTFDNPLTNAAPSPDQRAWAGCQFMAQNQRWLYWPLLKTGDTDLLEVGLNFYRNLAPVEEARAKLVLGVEGTPFDESLTSYGLTGTGSAPDGHNSHQHLRYHYTSGLEFALMMAEECRFTGCAPAKSMPVMMGMLKFYDSFYQKECLKFIGHPLDEQRHLVIFPGNSAEQASGCKNSSDAVGGLRAIASGLLKLDIPAADRVWVKGFLARLPPIFVTEKDGHRIIPIAESWLRLNQKEEFTQLYNFFPFHNYGVGLPDLELALNTWKYAALDEKVQKEAQCWKYGNTAAAALGLAEEAKDYALKKFLWPYNPGNKSLGSDKYAPFTARFPAFWVTYDWDAFPDMDHGGCAMVGLQEMLLQTPDDRILLLPAWPKEWDVNFKLHAPKNTTVEGVYRNGKLEELKVTPESRRKDVQIINGIEETK